VRGVVSGESGVPASGVVVLLTDTLGAPLARALTSESGAYRVQARIGGTFRLRTLRIGYKPETTAPFALASGQEITRDIALANIPLTLDTVRVAGRNACLSRGDTAVATYTMWEQVRAALTAAQLTTRASDISAILMTYERTLDPTFPRVRRQSTAFTSAISGRPWRSTSADSLRRYGYVIPDLLGGKSFLAPDLDVLLSASFLEDHCFKIAKGSDAKRVGIQFEPTKARENVVDISGTVWLDRATAELRQMEFNYENLEVAAENANPGGEMDFLRLRDGGWAISKWMIRMPILEEFNEKAGHQSMATQKVVRVSERKVTGGELVTVMRGDDTLWVRPPMVASGLIVDSASRDEVADARVSVLGTSFTATTDKKGVFSITGILPGEYTIEILTPQLDSVGGRHTVPFSVIESAARTRILLPPASSFAVQYCGERIETPVPAALALGTVRTKGDTLPPWNIWVIAEWTDKGPRKADARTDAQGRYRICGVPLNKAFTIRTELDDTATVPRAVEVPKRQRFLRRDIEIERPVMAAGTYFAGGVMTQFTREPISEAEIALPDLGLSARTNERGRFRLGGVPAGSHRVTVRKLGYAAFESTVQVAADAPTSRQFQLFKAATLDTVSVVADRRMSEFEENRRLGLGHFMTRADLEKLGGAPLRAVLSQIPGAGTLSGNGSHAWLVRGYRGVKPSSGCIPVDMVVDGWKGAKPCQCYAQVYLDGMLMYAGKPNVSGGIPEPLFDLSEINIQQIEAMEYYSNELQMPAKYMGHSAKCGVLVIYTRRDYKKK
jgi:hypothetical protein